MTKVHAKPNGAIIQSKTPVEIDKAAEPKNSTREEIVHLSKHTDTVVSDQLLWPSVNFLVLQDQT